MWFIYKHLSLLSRCHFSLPGVSRFHPKRKLKVTLHSEVLVKLHDKWRSSVEKQGGHIFEKPNSLRFPGHFKIFPWATQERKIQRNAFLLAIMSHLVHFPWVFQVLSTKIQISTSFPRGFDNFSNSLSFPGFPCFRHPENWRTGGQSLQSLYEL